MSTEYFGRAAQRWYSTPAMARYLGKSPDWLKKQMGTLFVEGIHYHRKEGVRDPFWDRIEMDAWITGTGDSAADAILQKMVS